MEPRISLITLGVQDLERSLRFYRDGLGFPTTWRVETGVIFCQMNGVCLALYPYNELAEDASQERLNPRPKFTGITLAHNVRDKEEVVQILELAEAAGGKIEKPAHEAEWGGFGGYFSDPDGYLWEVAWGAFEIRDDGSLVIP